MSSMSDRKMKITSLLIIFVVITIGAQCRAIALSNMGDADEETSVNTSEPLKELITLYEENFAKLINFAAEISNAKDNNKQEAPNNKWTLSINNVKNLIDTMKGIDIIYQDGEITDEHIRIKRAVQGATSFATSEERMTNMLIDIRRQLVQTQKYVDNLCKKHNLTSTTPEIKSDEVSSINHPNRVLII